MGHHQLPRGQRDRPADLGWLAQRLGRRTYFLLSIAIFTTRLGALRHGHEPRDADRRARVAGSRGGGLQPSSQAILLDAFPPERQGVAMTLFGMAALLARSSARRSVATSPTTTAGSGSST
jgi:MFS family permease